MFFKGILKIAQQPYHPLLVSSLSQSPKIRIAFHLLEILLKTWISSSPPPSLSTENTLYFKEAIKIKKDLPQLSPKTVHPFFHQHSSWGWSLTTCALWTTNLSCLLRNLALLSIILSFMFSLNIKKDSLIVNWMIIKHKYAYPLIQQVYF